jgi:hypothetical protein
MADEPDRDVLSSLPRSRPARRSGKRDAARASSRQQATTDQVAATAPTPRAARAGGRTKASAPSPPPPAGWATPDDADAAQPGGLELAGTVVRAVGEVAQIGVAVGANAVKGVLGRLPRP